MQFKVLNNAACCHHRIRGADPYMHQNSGPARTPHTPYHSLKVGIGRDGLAQGTTAGRADFPHSEHRVLRQALQQRYREGPVQVEAEKRDALAQNLQRGNREEKRVRRQTAVSKRGGNQGK